MIFRLTGRRGATAVAALCTTALGAIGTSHAVHTAGASDNIAPSSGLQFVVTSDAHYGLKRPSFRGMHDVAASVVNRALVESVNRLPMFRFPADSGVAAGERVDALDFLIEEGDIANRAEGGIQPAAVSWSQFAADYLRGVRTRGPNGRPTEVLVLPGNHDASNAVGFYAPLAPGRDATPMAAIYNMMVQPREARTAASFDYRRDRVHASRDIAGVHLVFLHIWPDSAERAWLATDLRNVARGVPVMLFAHDQPDVEPKHFLNPNASGDINATDRFENLLAERYKDGTALPVAVAGSTADRGSPIEERALAAFVQRHPEIRAYFHGNSNAHEFYTYRGPESNIALPTIRVDSPIKGHLSAGDETRLSFEVVSIDRTAGRMTVRECLWNTDGGRSLRWGESRTIALR